MIEKLNFMTDKVRDNCYPHIHLLRTHPHLASADFILLLPVATFADPHIHLLPIANYACEADEVGKAGDSYTAACAAVVRQTL